MTASATTGAAGSRSEAAVGRGLVTVAVMLATVMQVLDTTIANVALPHMQGSLSATQDQIAWVLTSYIVATAIMTPPTGWLAARFGRKRLLLAAVAGFTATSVLCGVSMSLEGMIVARVLQGVSGAALVPLSQSVLLDTYPRERHGQAMALWGVGIMVGPILGPTLGGYLTEYYSWRWVFFINLPLGLLALFLIGAVVPEAPHGRGARFDAFGFALLSIGIGALQLMLDRGEQLDWFSSTEIIVETGLAVLGIYMFAVHILTARHPFIDPNLFRDRNFVTGLLMIFVIGIVLLASLALMPPFLQHMLGYPSLTTGLVLAPRGAGTMVSMLVVGRLVTRVDPRLLITIGFGLIGLSQYQMTGFSLDVGMGAIIESGFIQGLGLGLTFVPLSTMAFATLAPEQRTTAASMFSLVRNIGSSIGISIVVTLLSRNTTINHALLSEHIPITGAAQRFAGLDGLSSASSELGLAVLNGEITRQAAMIAYIDDFKLIMWLAFAALPLLLLLRKPKRAAT